MGCDERADDCPNVIRYSARQREQMWKNRESAIAGTFKMPYIPKARNEFVLHLCSLLHERHELLRSSNVTEKTYPGEYLPHVVPDRARSTPLMEKEYHNSIDERFEGNRPRYCGLWTGASGATP